MLTFSDDFIFLAERDPRKFKCLHCGRTFQYKGSLLRHINYECTRMELKFSCPYCTCKTNKMKALKTHIAYRHPDGLDN